MGADGLDRDVAEPVSAADGAQRSGELLRFDAGAVRTGGRRASGRQPWAKLSAVRVWPAPGEETNVAGCGAWPNSGCGDGARRPLQADPAQPGQGVERIVRRDC